MSMVSYSLDIFISCQVTLCRCQQLQHSFIKHSSLFCDVPSNSVPSQYHLTIFKGSFFKYLCTCYWWRNKPLLFNNLVKYLPCVSWYWQRHFFFYFNSTHTECGLRVMRGSCCYTVQNLCAFLQLNSSLFFYTVTRN